ncbi:MAG: sulfite exporter TauE/SafE family protein [Actinobacteria bacterium]|nr:sulfite exporter TauE/SafE family protein [Actinomycetota bacterium]
MNWTEFALAVVTSAVGAVGGLGGAVLLVPFLVLTGTTPRAAAPLGLVSVAAGSSAAGARQLSAGLVNHRLGITTELFASGGAVAGALASGLASDRALKLVLAAVAFAAGVLSAKRKGIRNLPAEGLTSGDVGEHFGSLSGVYQLADGFVPYRAKRLPSGAALFGVAGILAGLSGASGGFVKTPATSEVMHVPVRVAAATTTFTIGVTSAAGLIVFALQDRLNLLSCATICAGSIVGATVGSAVQSRLGPAHVRRFLSAALVVVAVVLVVRA